jgi:hypothetical protein
MSTGKPKRPWPEGYQAVGRPAFFFTKDENEIEPTMAAKNTLKYKRNRLPPLLEIANDLIDKCLQTIQSPSFKATIHDLIRLIRLRLTLKPLHPPIITIRWVEPLRKLPKPKLLYNLYFHRHPGLVCPNELFNRITVAAPRLTGFGAV